MAPPRRRPDVVLRARLGPNRLPITRSAPSSRAASSARDLAGVVLAVGVELDGPPVAVGDGVAEAGLERAADPQVEGQDDDRDAPARATVGGVVGGPVVDHQHVDLRPPLVQLGEHVRQAGLLVEGRQDGQCRRERRAHGHGLVGHAMIRAH